MARNRRKKDRPWRKSRRNTRRTDDLPRPFFPPSPVKYPIRTPRKFSPVLPFRREDLSIKPGTATLVAHKRVSQESEIFVPQFFRHRPLQLPPKTECQRRRERRRYIFASGLGGRGNRPPTYRLRSFVRC